MLEIDFQELKYKNHLMYEELKNYIQDKKLRHLFHTAF
jgi:hypothetical protein